MAAKLKLVKRIVNEEVVNSFNLVLNVLFGGKVPDKYDENKTYNKGDTILINKDGKIEIVVVSKDGTTGGFDINNFQDITFTELFKDSSILTQNNTEIHNTQEAMSDDIATLVYELAGLLDKRMVLKVLFRENFRTADHLNITNGIHIPGSIQAVPGNGIDFKLDKPIELSINPTTFKIKHYTEIMGAPTMGCSITFNALDSNPYWFKANDALLSEDFFKIPTDQFVKEEGVPYALDIRIYGSCASGSSLKISDLMVVFI